MTNTTDWMDIYCKWLRDNTITSTLSNGWTEIGTPILDRHNDGIIIYIKKEGETITISDDGYTLNDLQISGIPIQRNTYQKILTNLLTSYGITQKDYELTTTATMSTFAVKKHLFIQGLLAINDMFLLSTKNIKSIFLDDVANFFIENKIIHTPNVSLAGKSGLTHHIDYIIPAATHNNKPEKLIKAFNTPREDIVKSALFSWNDIQKTRNTNPELVVFLNDQKPVKDKIIYALEEYKALPILWSKRAEHISNLSIA